MKFSKGAQVSSIGLAHMKVNPQWHRKLKLTQRHRKRPYCPAPPSPGLHSQAFEIPISVSQFVSFLTFLPILIKYTYTLVHRQYLPHLHIYSTWIHTSYFYEAWPSYTVAIDVPLGQGVLFRDSQRANTLGFTNHIAAQRVLPFDWEKKPPYKRMGLQSNKTSL